MIQWFMSVIKIRMKRTALSRDTKNANQRVEKQDLQKVQERQEMAKVKSTALTA